MSANATQPLLPILLLLLLHPQYLGFCSLSCCCCLYLQCVVRHEEDGTCPFFYCVYFQSVVRHGGGWILDSCWYFQSFVRHGEDCSCPSFCCLYFQSVVRQGGGWLLPLLLLFKLPECCEALGRISPALPSTVCISIVL